jgi:hypothetical protein
MNAFILRFAGFGGFLFSNPALVSQPQPAGLDFFHAAIERSAR